jgi:hypothetical protein
VKRTRRSPAACADERESAPPRNSPGLPRAEPDNGEWARTGSQENAGSDPPPRCQPADGAGQEWRGREAGGRVIGPGEMWRPVDGRSFRGERMRLAGELLGGSVSGQLGGSSRRFTTPRSFPQELSTGCPVSRETARQSRCGPVDDGPYPRISRLWTTPGQGCEGYGREAGLAGRTGAPTTPGDRPAAEAEVPPAGAPGVAASGAPTSGRGPRDREDRQGRGRPCRPEGSRSPRGWKVIPGITGRDSSGRPR